MLCNSSIYNNTANSSMYTNSQYELCCTQWLSICKYECSESNLSLEYGRYRIIHIKFGGWHLYSDSDQYHKQLYQYLSGSSDYCYHTIHIKCKYRYTKYQLYYS